MYFGEPQSSSTHAVSKPIDILRSTGSRQSSHTNEYRNPTSVEKQRPVNRVKPVIVKKPQSMSSSSSPFLQQQPSQQPSQQTRLNVENKENCNRMPMIYNLYANPPPSTVLRPVPVDALTRTLYNYIAVSPTCSSTDYFSDDEERLVDESDLLMPTEFRSIGDIIGYANVIKSQRQQTIDRFNATMSQLNWTTKARREAQMQ